ncbi:LacI family DNA-binding transcriptional regulator [Palleronia caenipelagi]|uniref:LacI family transcriptional regulator n=1 Tax=Palleronia caenipelagi TaxID=2489174 RepID=A0A547Q6N2_9RHOB|nr:LacI family DNA-binding transcriptional regulator [Palleronia caenipelagi]TRD22003.1 LacI family transcriptional regulator [Palleronia caenipelagi]
MARRPTIRDVAREAGFSVTTVDRALNGRARVREATMQRIIEAAHAVGYHARGLLQQNMSSSAPPMRLGFLLIKQQQEFYKILSREIEAAVARRTDIRGKAVIRYVTSQAPDDFAEAIRELGASCDAVGAGAVNHQKLAEAVGDLRAEGVPVFSMFNDFAQGLRRNYIGMNNVKVGRTAAWILSNTIRGPGKVAIFVGGNRWHGHDLREVGFRAYLREAAQGIHVLDPLINLETRQLTYEATMDLVGRHPDLAGIYVAGGGMEGAIAALRELHEAPKIRLVVNELTVETRAAMADGYVTMVICTPIADVCRDLVELMIRAVLDGDDGLSGQHFLDPMLVVPEML